MGIDCLEIHPPVCLAGGGLTDRCPLPPPLPLQNLTREQADYCVSHMKPYVDGKGRELPTAFDYVEFTRSLFVN